MRWSILLLRPRLAPAGLLSVALLSGMSGCASRWEALNVTALQNARLGLAEQAKAKHRRLVDEEERQASEEERPSTGSVILGELLAIFPGVLVHGLGHFYAGDHETGKRLSRIGQFGYLMTALGGGALVGGYFLDKEDLTGFAYSLYVTGGILGAVGVGYFFTAWIYDMIDTPRAVLSGGQPPPRSSFVESLDVLD